MKRISALLLALVFLLTACSQSESGGSGDPGQSGNADAGSFTASIPGGPEPVSGGEVVLRDMYSRELTTLDHNNESNALATYHASLVVTPLLDYDKYGVLQPALATEWTVSDDGMVYTFTLRDDVDWYTNDGEVYAPVTAHDFVHTAQYMLTAENANLLNGNLTSALAGAQEYLDGEITGFAEVGVKALDDYTLEYTLFQPTPYFLSMLTYISYYPTNGQFREEMGNRYGTSNDTILSCGPYLMTTYEPESRQVYEKNPNHYNAAAYHIDVVENTYNAEALSIGPELFLRGEIDEAQISTDIIDEWFNDPDLYDILYSEETPYSYFLAFNFDPRYDEEYGPDNWRTAVNNVNFRKSIYHAVDKISLAMTVDPYDPESRLLNTFTLPNSYFANGVDYVDLDALADVSRTSTHDLDLALSHKELAMQELADTVEFPVQVVIPYNSGTPDMVNRLQLLEQQLERDLGTDYIEVVLLSFPSTGYSTETRNAGIFSIAEVSWGPDYADPMASADPFNGDNAVGQRYGRVYLAEEGFDENGEPVYQAMLNAANEEAFDLEARYNLFAEAERYLLDNAYAIPFYQKNEFYVSNVDPFTGNYTSSGWARSRRLGQVLLERPYTREEYEAAEAQYQTEREAAMAAAG